MAKVLKKLTAKEVETAKPREKPYRIADGSGLYLLIRVTGLKYWEARYTKPATKKVTFIGLGSYPDLSLAEARQKTQEIRQLVAQGIDPKLEKDQRKDKLIKDQENTFFHVARLWAESKKNRLKEKTIKGNWRKLELYAFDALGNVPITKVTAPMAIASLRPLEQKGHLETIRRTAQLMNEIMTYALNYGLIETNPLAGIREVFQKPKPQHMLALKPNELPELVRAINRGNMTLSTKCLIEWQLHTMTRPNEASGARWEEIDLEKNLWVIPAERMKMSREHVIPLTAQTLAILDEIKPLTGHREFIFTSIRDPKKPTDAESINKALQRIGFKGRTTAHGLRALASTTLNEQGFNADVIEACLAHVDKNAIRKAYNRSTYLEQRQKVMGWWSEHIENALYNKQKLTGRKNLKAV